MCGQDHNLKMQNNVIFCNFCLDLKVIGNLDKFKCVSDTRSLYLENANVCK